MQIPAVWLSGRAFELTAGPTIARAVRAVTGRLEGKAEIPVV